MTTLVMVSLAAIAVPLVDGMRSQEKKDIVDVAVSAGSLKTLAAALQAADLVDTLKSPGPFTVFAPTDAAFAKLPEGALQKLLLPENKAKLQAVLTDHVVSGKLTAARVVRMTSATTVSGERLSILVKGSSVSVGGATVTAPDIPARNGVIHVIDTVMLPPGFSL